MDWFSKSPKIHRFGRNAARMWRSLDRAHGDAIECDEHAIATRREALWWRQMLSYDGMVVAKQWAIGNRTLVFWVSEAGREVRYEVDLRLGWRSTIHSVRRNGAGLSCRPESIEEVLF